jgi:hypothetical protein
VSTFREARRALQEAAAATPPLIDVASVEYDRFMRRLMKGPASHNWGLYIQYGAAEWGSMWDNAGFHRTRANHTGVLEGPGADFALHEREWDAQVGAPMYMPLL